MNSLSRQDYLPIIFSSPPFQVAALVILLAAVFYDLKELTILCILLIFMSVGAVAWKNFSIRGLQCSLSTNNNRSFPGENLEFRYIIKNKKHLPAWLKLEVRVDEQLLGNSKNNITIPGSSKSPAAHHISGRIPSNNIYFGKNRTVLSGEGLLFGMQNSSLTWNLNPRQRGIFKIGPLYLKAGDLLGLNRKEVELDEVKYIAVYPKIAALKSLPLPLSELFGIPGSKSPVVDPVYPVAAREYHPGNPSRHIHWKTSARFGKLYEKVFEPTTRQKVVLAIDINQFSGDINKGPLEAVLETAAAIAIRCEKNGVPYGLCSNGIAASINGSHYDGVILPAANSPDHLNSFLDYLAGITALPGSKTASGLLESLHLKAETTLLLFTYYPAASDKTLESIYLNYTSRVINIIVDGNPPGSKEVFCLDDLIHNTGFDD